MSGRTQEAVMAQRAPLSLDSVSTPPPAGPPPQENGRFPGLLFEVAPAAQDTGQRDEDRSFAADLNLGQIAAAIAGDREERDLITTVLYGRLRDSGAVRYRQEIFQDLYYQLGGWLA